ncbi:HNH endonuclease signature motif containing protein [Rhodococcoides fascians]|uniref:HNH endonuclease signature motif containing protein n=1 Tax=Rhodococcoides fascians TaxID=1828 RepID=UPI00050CDCE7|nr:HNH endonuclease signature motif containing protein [Rhodococcus fascians]
MTTSTRSRFAAYLGPQSKPYIEAVSLTEIRDVATLENQACARKVAVAAAIWDSCIQQNVLVGDVVQDAGNYAASEIAHVLGCSKSVANTYAEIGMDLRLRLPAVAAAFEAGELDLPRVRAIYRCTHNLTQDAAAAVQGEVLLAARRLSPGPLATETWSIMYRIAPEQAAALRKDLERHTNVTYTDKDVLSTLKADLTAADAAAAWQLINEMAATVCRRDPRNRGQKRAAAYVALLQQESSMACLCEPDDDNPCTADTVRRDRRTPLTVITVDLATLAGLLSNPAHLAGHGTIDAEYARELADNAHWQILLTEARNLAEKLGYGEDLESSIDLDSESGAGTEDKGAESSADSGSKNGQKKPRGSKVGKTRSSSSEGSKSHVVFHPLGRGRRRDGAAIPCPPRSQTSARPPRNSCVATPYRGTYTFVAELEAAIAANPTLGLALHPDGHGGLVLPPPGALVYRPSTALAERVRYRDRTCRHPGCDVAAQQCEIDHVVPYFHRDPATGGWTIDTNLHCLCRYHHSLKTMGLWTPVMLADGVEFWVSNGGTTAITVPGTTQLADLSHLPSVHRRPKGQALEPDTATLERAEPQPNPVPMAAPDDDSPPF